MSTKLSSRSILHITEEDCKEVAKSLNLEYNRHKINSKKTWVDIYFDDIDDDPSFSDTIILTVDIYGGISCFSVAGDTASTFPLRPVADILSKYDKF